MDRALISIDSPVDVPVIEAGHPLHEFLPAQLVPAAVLVPLIFRSGWKVILTQRTDKLTHHAGQISFPGGRREPQDGSFVETALRESQEEIGLDPQRVSLLGYLDSTPVITGFGVVPVVGLISGQPTLQLDPGEVQSVFEVPLDFLLDRDNYREEAISMPGRSGTYFVIQYEGWRIWGATAHMLLNFAQRVRGDG